MNWVATRQPFDSAARRGAGHFLEVRQTRAVGQQPVQADLGPGLGQFRQIASDRGVEIHLAPIAQHEGRVGRELLGDRTDLEHMARVRLDAELEIGEPGDPGIDQSAVANDAQHHCRQVVQPRLLRDVAVKRIGMGCLTERRHQPQHTDARQAQCPLPVQRRTHCGSGALAVGSSMVYRTVKPPR